MMDAARSREKTRGSACLLPAIRVSTSRIWASNVWGIYLSYCRTFKGFYVFPPIPAQVDADKREACELALKRQFWCCEQESVSPVSNL